MSIKVALKAVCLAAAVAMSGAAHAGLFYVDIGTSFGPVGGQVNPTSTSLKSQFTFQYQSQTTFTDKDNSLSLSAGDTTVTNAGLVPGADPALNNVTGFTPNQFGNTNSNNGYNSNWILSFGIENLTGSVYDIGLGGAPEITYNAGAVVKMYLFLASEGFATAHNFMNIAVVNGVSGTGGTVLNGKVDFTGIADTTYSNIFHSGTYSCGGLNGFFDLWSTCGDNPPGDLAIQFRADFNTDPNVVVNPIGVDGNGNLLLQTANVLHDGSASFDIPEPATLALVGLALIGAGAARRRKATC